MKTCMVVDIKYSPANERAAPLVYLLRIENFDYKCLVFPPLCSLKQPVSFLRSTVLIQFTQSKVGPSLIKIGASTEPHACLSIVDTYEQNFKFPQ